MFLVLRIGALTVAVMAVAVLVVLAASDPLATIVGLGISGALFWFVAWRVSRWLRVAVAECPHSGR